MGAREPMGQGDVQVDGVKVSDPKHELEGKKWTWMSTRKQEESMKGRRNP